MICEAGTILPLARGTGKSFLLLQALLSRHLLGSCMGCQSGFLLVLPAGEAVPGMCGARGTPLESVRVPCVASPLPFRSFAGASL